MELITEQTSYLLDAGIETLHRQSTGWLDEILFRRDEAAFLYELVMSASFKSVRAERKITVTKIEEVLVKTGTDIDSLKKEVEEHERSLNRLLETSREDETAYRERHKQIAEKLSEFETGFRKLKKDIFKLASVVNKKTKLIKK